MSPAIIPVSDDHISTLKLYRWLVGELSVHARGAPAGYLRSLPTDVTAQCLEHGIAQSSDECNILTRKNADADEDAVANLAAAFTSVTYGRIWDYDVLAELQSAIVETAWHTPAPANESWGLYASERDMFTFLIDDEQQIEVGNARLTKGFFCWNSETGPTTFGLTTFLFNHCCGNGVRHVIGC